MLHRHQCWTFLRVGLLGSVFSVWRVSLFPGRAHRCALSTDGISAASDSSLPGAYRLSVAPPPLPVGHIQWFIINA